MAPDLLCICHTAYACPVHPAEPAHDTCGDLVKLLEALTR